MATGSDGRCVVCRRRDGVAASTSYADASGAGTRRALLLVLVMTAGVTAAGVGIRAGRSAGPAALSAKGSLQMPSVAIDAPSTASPGSGHWAVDTASAAQPADPNAWRAAIPRVRVVVYTAAWCPACKEAKRWLGSHGYAYDDRDIDASEVNRIECKALNPRVSIPTFDIEGDIMIGFSGETFVAKLERAAQKKYAQVSRPALRPL